MLDDVYKNEPLDLGGLKLDYFPNGIVTPDEVFLELLKLDWIRVNNTPRSEYFCSDIGLPYTYGRGAGIRTYYPQSWTLMLKTLQKVSEEFAKCKQEVLFLNRYDNQKDQLGWHADDSPEMDDSRPITIISLGAERDIMFRANSDSSEKTYKFRLKHGSILLMPAGFQDTHMHRIPKSDNQTIGTRISLTFRGYVK